MPISVKTQKMLWGRAASRCAICLLELVMDASETDDESVVGEACHIVAEKLDGPRGQSELATGKRDKYDNLILLCNVHHKQVDDQVGTYTVEKLHDLKKKHEKWVRDSLVFDDKKQDDDEIYAGYIEHWERLMKLEEWQAWTSCLVSSGQPSLWTERKVAIEEVGPWLLSRVWPGRYSQVESALSNFRHVAQDLLKVFLEHAEDRGGEWKTEKFYRIDEWNEERYNQLLRRFSANVNLVQDLALELTRAANFVCDAVRAEMMRSYRLKEGVLVIHSGPDTSFNIRTYRAEYSGRERTQSPYPGLDEFKKVRFTRDVHFGEAGDEV
jgi:hypothetical protein